jgi:hypothetical protein
LYESDPLDVITSREGTQMFNRRVTACGVILGLVMAVSVKSWDNPSKTTSLTFSGPVRLPGVTLGAGTYVFELAAPETSADIVRVLSKDRSQVYLAVFTESVSRPAGMTAETQISFGEASAGVASPITAWYPAFDSRGHRFLYKSR